MPIDPKNLITRVAVSAVGIPAILFVSYQGGWGWSGFLMLLAFFGFWEYSRLTKLPGFLLFLGWVLGLGYLYRLSAGAARFLDEFLLIGFFAAAAFLVLRRKVEGSIAEAAHFILGLIYIPGLLGFGKSLELWLRQVPAGLNITFGGEDLFRMTEVPTELWLLIFLWAVIWTTDTAAYFVGAKLGRVHPFPTVSPNKTAEGFLGGFAGAALVAVIFFLAKKMEIGFGFTIGLALTIAFFGQLGDLFESLLKRNSDVKDASHLIAGHGGVLDRFDSFLFALPAAFFFVVFFA
ncbi:MAG TPA: phosphatidate cytidylyltransferase [candidate division Zixibacteria bacterium]|nr:phosphatidate cytidylyltransferase [candidate division Zixibacteria bacterium]